MFKNWKRQKGFTFTEILIVLAIIAGVTVLVLSQAGTVIGTSSIDRAASDIRAIVGAAQRYRATRPNYAGITMEQLLNRNLLPESIGTGVATNPWGGSYLVGPSTAMGGNLNERVTVVLTNLPDNQTAAALTDTVGNATVCKDTASAMAFIGVSNCLLSNFTDGAGMANGAMLTGAEVESTNTGVDTEVNTADDTYSVTWQDTGTTVVWGHAFR